MHEHPAANDSGSRNGFAAGAAGVLRSVLRRPRHPRRRLRTGRGSRSCRRCSGASMYASQQATWRAPGEQHDAPVPRRGRSRSARRDSVAASYSADAGHRIYRRAEAAGLDPAHFGAASFVVLYSTIGRMVEANIPVDAVSVAAELDRDHADPHVIQRLRVLAASVPASTHRDGTRAS